MRFLPSSALAVAAAAVAVAVSSPARADDKQACIDAFEKSQQLRKEGKLHDARNKLAICSAAACPSLVRQECTSWMGEVTNAIPSIVVAARDESGRDILAVQVSIDGKVVAERLEGRPIPLDPGVHTVRLASAGMATTEQQVLMREGERGRPITVTLKPGDSTPPSTAAQSTGSGTAVAADTSSDSGASSAPILAYTLIGVGVVALGAAVVVDIGATGDAHDLRDTCAGHCATEDVDSVRSRYVLAGVLGGAGLIAAGVGTVLLITRKPAATQEQPKAAATWFGITPTHGGVAAAMGTRF